MLHTLRTRFSKYFFHKPYGKLDQDRFNEIMQVQYSMYYSLVNIYFLLIIVTPAFRLSPAPAPPLPDGQASRGT